MKCPNCSVEIPPNALFCHRCGVSIDEEASAAARSGPDDRGASDNPAGERGSRLQSVSSQASDHPRDRLGPGRLGGSRDYDDPEKELWQGGVSPKAMLSSWIGAGLLSVVALVAALALSLEGTGWLVVIGLTVAGWLGLLLRLVYLRINYSYRLTSQRFIHETGILRRVTNRVEVIDIDDVEFEQGFVDRFVGVGTLRMTSSDHSHGELALRGIDGVKEVAGIIYNARRKERVKRGLHIESI